MSELTIETKIEYLSRRMTLLRRALIGLSAESNGTAVLELQVLIEELTSLIQLAGIEPDAESDELNIADTRH